MLGVDISTWQDVHDYTALTESINFAVLKAGGSNAGRYRDSKYDRHAAGIAGRVPVGSYWMNGEGDPVQDATFFTQGLHRAAQEFVVLDIEDLPGEGMGHWTPAQALAWVRRVQDMLPGVPVLAYMNSSLAAAEDWTPLAREGVMLWIANYGRDDGTRHNEPSTGTWPAGWVIHQFTQHGRIPGYHGDIDLNHANSLAWLTPQKKEEEEDMRPFLYFTNTSDGKSYAINKFTGKEWYIPSPAWVHLLWSLQLLDPEEKRVAMPQNVFDFCRNLLSLTGAADADTEKKAQEIDQKMERVLDEAAALRSEVHRAR